MNNKAVLLVPILFSSVLLLFSGCLHSPVAHSEPPEFTDDYLDIWNFFQTYYPLFVFKDINWVETGNEYYYKVIDCSSEEEFYAVLVEMLATLEDPQISFRSSSNENFETWENQFTANVDRQVLVDNYLNNYGFTACSLGTGYCDPALLPYIQIDSLSYRYEAADLVVIDSLIAEWNGMSLPAVIVDLRIQTNKSTNNCEWFAGRFTDSIHPGAIFRSRNGPEYWNYFDNVNAIHSSGPDQFLGTVIILVGEQNRLGIEIMCADMINNTRVVLVGDTTMGSVSFSGGLATTNGIFLKATAGTVLTREWEWIEGVGLPPDHFVESSPEDFAAGVDPVLEYAIELLEQY